MMGVTKKLQNGGVAWLGKLLIFMAWPDYHPVWVFSDSLSFYERGLYENEPSSTPNQGAILF
jgi:hypothetical protein